LRRRFPNTAYRSEKFSINAGPGRACGDTSGRMSLRSRPPAPTPRGGWKGNFLLTMRDGVDFDIMTWPRRLVRAYPEIVRALEGVEFAFSSRSVSPNCKVSYADLLTRRP